ncbi:hypothetical protein Bhyg_02412 [Pseudolycoriella hygida]|uniref:Organic solvent tolerance-like N-terminal domain-containing protein n=1 Tax=Pseudolycoriella hygida TaxID=35572 RepID=A0A9Q0NBE2_9DIPT|nr:hypothetical protein Bhyg_02412 [Pseudolycoriella hygida]
MRIEAFSILLIICQICLSRSENIDTVQRIETNKTVENAINYNLISNKDSDPNDFRNEYEITFEEFIFKRSEKCLIIEEADIRKGNSDLSCSGKTQFSRTGDIQNITNFDEYTYSTNGFNHTGQTFTVSGNFYHLNEIDLIYGLEAEPITANLNRTKSTKSLQFSRPEKNQLKVDFTMDSTFFSLNRTEYFSVGIDEETGTRSLRCEGQITITVRNSEKYYTVQREHFRLDEDYAFVYESDAKLISKNDTSE